MEAIIASAKREDNIQRIIVTENVIPPQVSEPAQPQTVRIPVESPAIQEIPIVRDGHSSPHDAIEYHCFALSMHNSQG